MDKQQLIEQFEAGTINRQSKGVLRRIVIKEIFEDLIEQPLEIIAKILNKKRTKVDLKELAKLVGYEIKDTNIRQSFMNEVRPFQDKLREKGHIKVVEKNRTQEKDENAKALIDFLHARLAEPDYKWPMHLRGNLYRRAIWAYFIDTPLDEVKYPGAPMSQKEVTELCALIDVKMVNKELQTIDYSSASATDEMSDTMESKVISRLRKELKESKEQLVEERETRLDLEKEIEQFKYKKKESLGAGRDAIKAESIRE